MDFQFANPEQIAEHHETMLAKILEQRHRMFRFMTELKPEDLGTFVDMLQVAKDNDEFIPYLIGCAMTIQQLQNNRCICGNDHDSDAIERERLKIQSEREEENNQAPMLAYGLIRKEDGRLHCRDCDLEYVSLNDRMVKPPGASGCHGCQQKSAWG